MLSEEEVSCKGLRKPLKYLRMVCMVKIFKKKINLQALKYRQAAPEIKVAKKAKALKKAALKKLRLQNNMHEAMIIANERYWYSFSRIDLSFCTKPFI